MTDSEFLGLSLLLGPEDSGAAIHGVHSAGGDLVRLRRRPLAVKFLGDFLSPGRGDAAFHGVLRASVGVMALAGA